MPAPSLGWSRAAMLLQTFFAAGTFLVTKAALGTPGAPGPLDPIRLMTLRFAGVLALLLPLTFPRAARARVPRSRRIALALLGLLTVHVNVGLFFEGAARAPASHAALCYALTPVFVFAIESARGRVRASRRMLAGLGLAVAGAATVLAGRGSIEGPRALGDLLLLGAAAAWAIYTVFSRPLVAELGSQTTMVASLVAGSALWMPIGIPLSMPLDLAAIPLGAWGAVAYLAAITTVASYALWLFALRRLDATRVAVFSNLQPVATAILAWLLLREPVTTEFVVGTALVLAGVTLVQRARA